MKEGDKLEINGIPIRICSQEEMNDAAENGDMVYLAMPVDMIDKPITGSQKSFCGTCGCDVWMSPASLKSKPNKAQIRCVRCVTEKSDFLPED